MTYHRWRGRLALAIATLALGASLVRAESWSFGVIPDTQWSPAAGRADKGVAGDIIDDINQQFVQAGVKFVVAVGDLGNNSGADPDELDIRARHNAALAAAGIRFFPLRGNHDASLAASRRFPLAFPGLPGSADFAATDGFSAEPAPSFVGLAGRSYAFSYRDAAFVLLDQFTQDDGTEKGRSYPIAEQLEWLRTTLAAAHAAGRQAFVFGHKNLLGQGHKDNLFGNPQNDKDPGDQGPERQAVLASFVSAMRDNGARWYISGHDHQYYRSMVEPEGADPASGVQQMICGSASHKFYNASPPFSEHDHPLAHQRNQVGYFIITVDGPQVTGRYYAVDVPTAGGSISNWQTPPAWPLVDTFGYGSNGRQVFVPSGTDWPEVLDAAPTDQGYLGTKAAITPSGPVSLGTTAASSADNRRPLDGLLTTGWAPRPTTELASDVLTIYGLQPIGTTSVPTRFVLSMHCPSADVQGLAICSLDGENKWVNAVALGSGPVAVRRNGPCPPDAPVGDWGADAATGIVWAVLERDGQFALGKPKD